jgi:hypothetical protein
VAFGAPRRIMLGEDPFPHAFHGLSPAGSGFGMGCRVHRIGGANIIAVRDATARWECFRKEAAGGCGLWPVSVVGWFDSTPKNICGSKVSQG